MDLEVEHEEVSEAYSLLSHHARGFKTQIATLQADIAARDKQILLVESQRDEAEERGRELEERVGALEAMLEKLMEEAEDEDSGL